MNRLKRTWMLIVILISPCILTASDQHFTIEGYVYNTETQEPVDNANIFLEGTTRGCATDQNGHFVIMDVKEGHYILVAQHIAYKLYTCNLSTYKEAELTREILLDPQILQADTIQIIAAAPTSWRKNIKTFKREFLGKSMNSRKCKLLNPEIVEFKKSEHGDTLYAYTDSILIVENRSLGYKLNIILDEFRCVHNKLEFYKIHPQFISLEPKNTQEKQRWEIQRERTYTGSLRHFLTSIAHETTEEEQFDWIHTTNRNIELKQQLLESASKTKLNAIHYRVSHLTGLVFSHYLMVTHKKQFQLYNWSVLKLTSSMTFIDQNGSLKRPEDLLIEGKWYKDRVSDLLPSDYRP